MRKRTTAEWVTFGAACAVVLLLIGLILAQLPGHDEPPAPRAEVAGAVERRGDAYVVPVEVRNDGDLTAENVQVVAALRVGAETVESDQVIDFLAGGESEEVEFVFQEDPRSGELTVRVGGYSVP